MHHPFGLGKPQLVALLLLVLLSMAMLLTAQMAN